MLIPFFFKLRESGVPASITEYLTLMEALKEHVAAYQVEDFYFLARAPQKALSEWEKALRLDPDNEELKSVVSETKNFLD